MAEHKMLAIAADVPFMVGCQMTVKRCNADIVSRNNPSLFSDGKNSFK
jgi:hypothetical protein